MTETEQLLRTPDVIAITGATYRQLNYWTVAGYITPTEVLRSSRARPAPDGIDPARPGEGRVRLWHLDEVEVIRRIVILAKAGLTVELAVRVACAGGPVDLGDGVTIRTPWGAV